MLERGESSGTHLHTSETKEDDKEKLESDSDDNVKLKSETTVGQNKLLVILRILLSSIF